MGLDIHFFLGDKQKGCADKNIQVGYFKDFYPILYWMNNNVKSIQKGKEILMPKHTLEQLLADLDRLTEDNCNEVFATYHADYNEDYWLEVEDLKRVLRAFDLDNYGLFFWAWW
ncbi:hypothetical protein [Xenorhabdus innexi]|uniref:Uncharacterized protein n=1 Tax=Xenorhabdus innexi TaxID=290109 RepID=A0A1N6N0S3_9GAMM|nr:hypothetical protein [Xenorhabdus innexi]PHM27828.1 hypothetical protein Xinn_03913 [Xenorhabdus innexi]SIP74665.1 conserved hypothetical protein [Xenorhabdus innexi]